MSNISASLGDALIKSTNNTNYFLDGLENDFSDNLKGIFYLTNLIGDVIEKNYSIGNTKNFYKSAMGLNQSNISFNDNVYNDTLEDSEFYIRFIIGGFGCFFNIINVLFFFFTSLKNTPSIAHEIIAYINISSLINTLSYLLLFIKEGVPYNTSLCQLQGFSMVFSEISEISTLTIISLHIFNILKTSTDEFDARDRIKNIFFAFAFPFFITLIGYFFDIYGENGHWCWIKSIYCRNIGMIFYCVVWIFLILSLILIIKSNINIRNLNVINSVAFVQINYYISYVKKVSVFPITLIVFWIFPTVNRIVSMYGGEKIEIIELLHLIFDLSLGFFISIASFLFLDWEQIMNAIEKIMKKCKCCSPKNKINSSNNCLLSSSDFMN